MKDCWSPPGVATPQIPGDVSLVGGEGRRSPWCWGGSIWQEKTTKHLKDQKVFWNIIHWCSKNSEKKSKNHPKIFETLGLLQLTQPQRAFFVGARQLGSFGGGTTGTTLQGLALPEPCWYLASVETGELLWGLAFFFLRWLFWGRTVLVKM